MTDPLSTTASIIAALQAVNAAVGYIVGVKDSSMERERMLVELCGYSGILTVLVEREKDAKGKFASENGAPDGTSCETQTEAKYSKQDDFATEQAWSLTKDSLKMPGGPLEKFAELLSNLNSKLKPPSGWGKVRALKWPFDKKEASRIVKALERYKSFFIMALQYQHTLVIAQNVTSTCTQLYRTLLESIMEDIEGTHLKLDQIQTIQKRNCQHLIRCQASQMTLLYLR